MYCILFMLFSLNKGSVNVTLLIYKVILFPWTSARLNVENSERGSETGIVISQLHKFAFAAATGLSWSFIKLQLFPYHCSSMTSKKMFNSSNLHVSKVWENFYFVTDRFYFFHIVQKSLKENCLISCWTTQKYMCCLITV